VCSAKPHESPGDDEIAAKLDAVCGDHPSELDPTAVADQWAAVGDTW
jgi:hypothetical protein